MQFCCCSSTSTPSRVQKFTQFLHVIVFLLLLYLKNFLKCCYCFIIIAATYKFDSNSIYLSSSWENVCLLLCCILLPIKHFIIIIINGIKKEKEKKRLMWMTMRMPSIYMKCLRNIINSLIMPHKCHILDLKEKNDDDVSFLSTEMMQNIMLLKFIRWWWWYELNLLLSSVLSRSIIHSIINMQCHY